eukprot:PLAT9148.3.p1 GENE.PLAT9148.3~~PLAT9148.3.p1  ORF type:complete len:331 (+),score=123.03 PLAT9148.3:159-1151(+)
MVVLAYFFIPMEVRANKQRMRLVFMAWIITVALTGFTLVGLLYRALFRVLDGSLQAALVMALPLVRLGSLRALEWLTGKAAPDGSLDAPVSFALKHYNSFFAATLYGNATGASSVLLVLQELVGSSFYLIKMAGVGRRLRCWWNGRTDLVTPMEETLEAEFDQSIRAGDIDGGEMEGGADSSSTLFRCRWRQEVLYGKHGLPRRFRRTLRTSGFLAMEELVENMVAMQWVTILAVSYLSYQREAMYVIRDMTDISFNRSLGFLGISSLVEVAMFFVACVVCYRRFGISLLHHAAYLLKKHMRFLLATSSILMAYTVSILFRFNGFGLLLG